MTARPHGGGRRRRRGGAAALAAATALAALAGCGQRGPLVRPGGLPEVEPVAVPAPENADDDEDGDSE